MKTGSKHRGGGRRPGKQRVTKYRQGAGKIFNQKDDFEVRDEARWRWAAERVPPWGKVQKDDYDFSSWMKKGAREELLNAGCLYEYARESHQFRCLLVLSRAPQRERFWSPSLMEFERSSAGFIHLIQSGWKGWLEGFADELISNKNFAEVLRTSRSKVEKSLDALADYNLYPNAVELPGRYINVPGMQEVVIDWRHYTNKEIAAEIACKRPENEPEPNRRGREPQSKAVLKALSVMRIWKRERKTWERLKLIAKVCRFKSCVYEWPITEAARAEMTRARTRALNAFQLWFPWGEPCNY